MSWAGAKNLFPIQTETEDFVMRHRVPTFALGSLAAALLAACGGGGGGSEAPKTTLSGTVADGYLKGATVCLDVNGNSICDSGEPSG